ncbi:hypothetical protein F4859DRAFT_100467 [Xylaria cf. heliscus]|nr:hypothetical protein F4859DRAFT_100467 [Xylaria cf. heliscus]
MASEPRRPPTRTGSGSRPPTSRFQEGSMNDRTSAAPPAQFLGPEQLKNYENQFYSDPVRYEARRQRPFSASGQLQLPRNNGGQELQQQKHTVTHKKSTGFFGRVRDALFNRGAGHHGLAALKQNDARRKHSSLQEPLQHPQAPPPPRPDFLQHAGRAQSEVNITRMFTDMRGGGVGERPSREDVLASYNQLMASGFFQAHAIQSTRHAPPGAAGGRQAPVLPMDPPAAPCPPVRISSLQKSARPTSISPMPARVAAPSPSPNPKSRNSRDFGAAPRASLSSLFRPSFPDLNTKDSRYTLRGRKRTRGDETPVTSPEPQSSSSTSYFTEPLRRVAKKLRSSSQLNDKSTSKNNTNHNTNTTVCVTQEPSYEMTPAVRLVPSISTGGSVHPNERTIQLRSPSPTLPDMTAAAGYSERRSSERPICEPVISAATRPRRPRKTFSYTVTESARSQRRAAEREQRERELRSQFQQQQRDSSVDDSSSSMARPPTRGRQLMQSQNDNNNYISVNNNPLGQWQRVSLEDTVVHRDSTDSTWSQWDWEWEQRHAAEVRIASSPGNGTTTTTPNKLRKAAPQSSPLRAIPDANRSISKTPERWHHSGKAYHLKDRGSRPDLATMLTAAAAASRGRSEDRMSAPRAGPDYGKENDWLRVDADGDIDILGYETHLPRDKGYSHQQHEQQLHQWRIGNAL